MTIPSVIAVLLTLTALFAYLNHKVVHLPPAVGLMGISLIFSLLMIAAGKVGFPLRVWAASMVSGIDFSQALLNGMLSFLLFAGALHVDLDELRDQKRAIAILATFGVIVSTVLVGGASWLLFRSLGMQVSIIACLTFGALISPTDPIAVMALLKDSKAPASLSTKFAGEALFNDGVGIVIFVMMFRVLVQGDKQFNWPETSMLLLEEAGGGIILGLVLGSLCFLLIKTVDNYQIEVMLTLALVSGGYELASAVHASGALAIVTAGLLIGNYGRRLAMSDETRGNLDRFWGLLDEILNGVLFVLMGLEVLLLEFKPIYLIAAALVIPVVLGARFFSLALPSAILHLGRKEGLSVLLLTWGGLRGGISIALALALPAGTTRDAVLVATYGVVAFSILVQATTMPWLLRKSPPVDFVGEQQPVAWPP